MREPAAHGIATMLKLFFDGDDESCKISQNLVEDVVIPKLLAVTTDQGEEEERLLHRQKLLEGYCAEQIRIAEQTPTMHLMQHSHMRHQH